MYPTFSTAASFVPSLLDAIESHTLEPEEFERVLQLIPKVVETDPAVTVGVAHV